ncbi:MAG: hypothetical protein CK424_05780 [Legionella sp.]|nr:MAG: hypothetical protein CK424_05780 [Legionella sp.]
MFYRLSTIFHAFKALFRLSPKEVEDYIKSYDIYECDWVHGQAMKGTEAVDYQEVKAHILDFYEVINHLCAIGEVEKMYIPPALDLSKNIINNQLLFEKKFAQLLDLKRGDKVFELGCGKGRVAAHLASEMGVEITGINIDQGQLDNAMAFAKHNKLSEQCLFLNMDFNELPFPFADDSFDAIYEIQALSLSRDLGKLFQELYRILKPGGKISLLEWVRLPNYDEHNPYHAELMHKVKPLIGAIGTPSPSEYEAALRHAGFEVLVSEDPGVNHSQEPLIHKASHSFDKLVPFVRILVTLHIIPKHFVPLFARLQKNTEALCEADRLGLITTCYHVVAQKNSVF